MLNCCEGCAKVDFGGEKEEAHRLPISITIKNNITENFNLSNLDSLP
jgi:hypothetical protein